MGFSVLLGYLMVMLGAGDGSVCLRWSDRVEPVEPAVVL